VRIVITGASSGIGEALARHYAADGVVLGLISRRKASGHSLAGKIVAYALDVTDEQALAAAAQDFIGRFGAPDLVIANAEENRPEDVAALRAAGVGTGFRLLLDFGTVHGLSDAGRAAVGREVSAVAAPDATLLMLAWTPGRRGPLPRGASRDEIEAAFPGWTAVDEEAADVTGAPRLVRSAAPRFYRLRRE
jgi:NAD(P)-dependent dehydrogenase (short-subunit alcohol dehydrogenase family)